MENLITRYQAVVAEIEKATAEAGRPQGSVRLIAVSKTKPFEMIEALYKEGQRDFGENYVQELVEKSEQAQANDMTEIHWHFLGHLQTNKVKVLLPHVHLIHSVDSERLMREIQKRASKKISALIEVKVDPEETKSGVMLDDVEALLMEVREFQWVNLCGLMGIPDPNRAGGARAAFDLLRSEASKWGLRELSMGMTADYPEAIAAGSTYVRVGTAIFGHRA